VAWLEAVVGAVMVRYKVFWMKFEVFDAGEVERPWAKLF
jgi:hypothetical protein